MDGVLVLAKPAGPTSHDMVALVRRLSATRRVGHGGTLDPFASGVLPLFLGSATRLVEYHMADRKAYRATVCFGATSTTDDLEGELTPVDAPAPSRASVEAALASFRGAISQLPPDYSAIKVSGRRAYALARAGQKPQLTTRDVTIDRLELTDWDESDTLRPLAILEIECSAGTYVRSIARDLGAALGTGAYLGALVRTASGPFRLENAVSLEEVRAAAAEGPARLAALLQPPDAGLHAFPRLELELNEIAAIARGQFVKPGRPVPPLPDDTTHLRLVDGAGRLVAIGTARGGRLVPEKVFLPGSDIPPLVDAGRGSARIDPELEAAIAAERDPSADEDPDPASPDDF